jgi:preprotein translocase subunit SecB
MKITESNLELVEFAIINSNYKFIDPQTKIEDTKAVFNKYEMEIDFGKKDIKTDEDEHLFNVIVKTIINQTDEPQPGYQLLAEGISIFRIHNAQEIDNKTLTNLKNISALSIAINNLRNYITNMTAYGPFGKFILPAVDVNQLIKNKIESQTKNKDN